MPNRSAGQPPSGEHSPAMPSFASLRDPRRRTAVDVLMAGAPAPATPAAAAPLPPAAAPRAAAAAPPAAAAAQSAAATRPAAARRPAEYGDLFRFGVRLLRGAASLPVRVVRWSVREPLGCLRRPAG